jgi:hypothetical protein
MKLLALLSWAWLGLVFGLYLNGLSDVLGALLRLVRP